MPRRQPQAPHARHPAHHGPHLLALLVPPDLRLVARLPRDHLALGQLRTGDAAHGGPDGCAALGVDGDGGGGGGEGLGVVVRAGGVEGGGGGVEGVGGAGVELWGDVCGGRDGGEEDVGGEGGGGGGLDDDAVAAGGEEGGAWEERGRPGAGGEEDVGCGEGGGRGGVVWGVGYGCDGGGVVGVVEGGGTAQDEGCAGGLGEFGHGGSVEVGVDLGRVAGGADFGVGFDAGGLDPVQVGWEVGLLAGVLGLEVYIGAKHASVPPELVAAVLLGKLAVSLEAQGCQAFWSGPVG